MQSDGEAMGGAAVVIGSSLTTLSLRRVVVGGVLVYQVLLEA